MGPFGPHITLNLSKIEKQTKNKNKQQNINKKKDVENQNQDVTEFHHQSPPQRRATSENAYLEKLPDPPKILFGTFLQKCKCRLQYPRRTKKSRESITANPVDWICDNETTISIVLPEVQGSPPKTFGTLYKIRKQLNEYHQTPLFLLWFRAIIFGQHVIS